MSSHIQGVDRAQVLMLPECVEDYVGEQNSVRFIDAFVSELCLSKVQLPVATGPEGRPSYNPRDLLKLYIYGYLNRIRSSRQLEAQTYCNLEVIWLLRQLHPDHKTISEFRRRNHTCFKEVLRQFNVLCRQLDLFGRELLAIDGTIFKAVNARARNFTQERLQKALVKIDEGIERYLQEAQAVDQQESAPGPARGAAEDKLGEKLAQWRQRKVQYEQLLQDMKQSGAKQGSLTDRDSKLLKKSTTGAAQVGYNVQSAVDGKHHLIVEVEATTASNDFGQLTPMATEAKKQLEVEHLEVVADGGYRDSADIAQCQKAGINIYVPTPRDPHRAQGLYGRREFSYDADQDVCRCPVGKELIRHQDTEIRGKVYHVYYNAGACAQCALRAQCTRGKYRKLKRQEGQQALEDAQARSQARPDIYGRRKGIVEHPFGTIKFWWGYGAFLMRGKSKVNAEAQLSALAYNLRRVLNLLGVKRLLQQLGC